MPNLFSPSSLANLHNVHPSLFKLAFAVLSRVDCSLVAGHRGEEAQNNCFENGTSKARWGQSPHNLSPSWAIDLWPHPVSWHDWSVWQDFAHIVLEEAAKLGISVAWGGNFTTKDGPHFELKGWREEAEKQFPGALSTLS